MVSNETDRRVAGHWVVILYRLTFGFRRRFTAKLRGRDGGLTSGHIGFGRLDDRSYTELKGAVEVAQVSSRRPGRRAG